MAETRQEGGREIRIDRRRRGVIAFIFHSAVELRRELARVLMELCCRRGDGGVAPRGAAEYEEREGGGEEEILD